MDISNQLIQWYLQNKRDLPWRKTSNPYKIWLSEIILQQTRINQGLSYYFKFLENFPTINDLANAKEQQILKLWQGLGYYSRARNLHFSAKYIMNELNGVFPKTYNDLLQLKGVGDYSASAIASICYNEATAVVDGNVYRVLARFFGIQTAINSTKGKKKFKQLAQELIDKKQPGIFNQAIMEFGAIVCKPQNPLCSTCVLNAGCVALQKEIIQILPVKENKVTISKKYFNYLVVFTNNGKTILQQRKKGIWLNMYEFPLIETTNEISETELFNHQKFQKIFKNVNVNVEQFNLTPIIHKLSHQHIFATFWIVKVEEIKQAIVNYKDVKNYPVSVLIDNFLKHYKIS